MGEPAERIEEPRAAVVPRLELDFDSAFRGLFDVHFPKLFRFLDRLGGDPDLASDLAQEAFIKLYQRGSLPDSPASWLVTVAMNSFRNRRTASSRRARLLTIARGSAAHSDAATDPSVHVEQDEARARVRAALLRLPVRDRQLLLLRAEGYEYRELSQMVGIAETSVGTMLARAKDALRREMTREA